MSILVLLTFYNSAKTKMFFLHLNQHYPWEIYMNVFQTQVGTHLKLDCQMSLWSPCLSARAEWNSPSCQGTSRAKLNRPNYHSTLELRMSEWNSLSCRGTLPVIYVYQDLYWLLPTPTPCPHSCRPEVKAKVKWRTVKRWKGDFLDIFALLFL